MSNNKTPIVHGFIDPCAIPYRCTKCAFMIHNPGTRAYCAYHENGKLCPEPMERCYRNKTMYHGEIPTRGGTNEESVQNEDATADAGATNDENTTT